MINVYIPLSEYPKQVVYEAVLLSLKEQTIPNNVIVFQSGGDPGIVQTHRTYNELTTASKVKNRNDARDHFLNTEEEFCLIQDYDCKHLFNTNLEDALNFLIKNKDYGAISFKYSKRVENDLTYPHIDAGCVMWRRDCLNQIKFRGVAGQCTCRFLTYDIRSKGCKFGGLDNINRVHEM